jgi:broad specificity phosphatase PhoE
MRLYLITHAHTQLAPEVDSRSWQLSSQGSRQAELLAQQPFWREVQRIVLSSEPKTRLTVEPLLVRRAMPVVEDARFDELHRPGWVEEYNARVRHAFAYPEESAGEWEPAASALARFLAGIGALCTAFPTETLALVGHGLTLSLYRAHLLGRTHVDYEEWRQLSFAAVALVDPLAQRLIEDFTAVAGQMARG